MELLHSGKVRDVYADGDDLILVASDRVSVYDVILPTPIPDKGKILTQLSLWWFGQLTGIVPHHVISATDVPVEFSGRAIRVKRLTMVQVECIARGYLAGSGWTQYQADRTVSGVALPEGLTESARLPGPVFTPTTKAPMGAHDEAITFAEVEEAVGGDVAEELRRVTLEIYARGAEIASARGILIADTKIELGWDASGTLTLGDEVLTPDSSRFWRAAGYQPGRPQQSLDKQFVRDFSTASGWDRMPPGPEIPDEVVAATQARYIEAYELLTGERWR